ncbi:MAG: hypothetical protein N3B01_01665 [Verrucomicrobiae bacterium]|nr:hypothetical protein [Verrucomicrobiae bacterium]
MNGLFRPLGRRDLRKAEVALVVLAGFFALLFYGMEHSITVLSNAAVPEMSRRAFENDVMLLRLTAAGMALCGAGIGACLAAIYFLWRGFSQARPDPTPRS